MGKGVANMRSRILALMLLTSSLGLKIWTPRWRWPCRAEGRTVAKREEAGQLAGLFGNRCGGLLAYRLPVWVRSLMRAALPDSPRR
jgi:hypothetical protein